MKRWTKNCPQVLFPPVNHKQPRWRCGGSPVYAVWDPRCRLLLPGAALSTLCRRCRRAVRRSRPGAPPRRSRQLAPPSAAEIVTRRPRRGQLTTELHSRVDHGALLPSYPSQRPWLPLTKGPGDGCMQWWAAAGGPATCSLFQGGEVLINWAGRWQVRYI